MELIFVVLLILAASVVAIAIREDNKKNAAALSNNDNADRDVKSSVADPAKCGCGKTKDVNGNCDGSHMDA